MQLLKRLLLALLNATLVPLAALLLIFEEWGWEPLARLIIRLGRLPLWAWIERLIRRLPPYWALLLLSVPGLALIPVKLLALYWLAEGDVFLGVVVVVGAKVLGTAVVAWLFMLTQPSLMRLRWFARLYQRWKDFKDPLIARYRASAVWRAGARLKGSARAMGLRRLEAMRRWWRAQRR